MFGNICDNIRDLCGSHDVTEKSRNQPDLWPVVLAESEEMRRAGQPARPVAIVWRRLYKIGIGR